MYAYSQRVRTEKTDNYIPTATANFSLRLFYLTRVCIVLWLLVLSHWCVAITNELSQKSLKTESKAKIGRYCILSSLWDTGEPIGTAALMYIWTCTSILLFQNKAVTLKYILYHIDICILVDCDVWPELTSFVEKKERVRVLWWSVSEPS